MGRQNYSGPIVILVDKLSASASEILAGVIQDYDRGLVVGSQTFGKGTVQRMVELSHGKAQPFAGLFLFQMFGCPLLILYRSLV